MLLIEKRPTVEELQHIFDHNDERINEEDVKFNPVSKEVS